MIRFCHITFVLFFTVFSSNAAKLNVLLIVCDDLNNHLSSSGYEHIKTPVISSFAAESMSFNRAYCQYPVCGPSRASFLSGLYPESTTVLNNKLDIDDVRPNTVMLSSFFKQNGYWTGGTGKIYHGSQGADKWHEYVKPRNDPSPVYLKLQAEFEAKHGSIEERKNKQKWKAIVNKEPLAFVNGQNPPGNGPTPLSDEQHGDGKNVRQISKWLDSKAYGKKPFFLACGIYKPHVPYWAPQKYFDLYPRNKLVLANPPANDWDDIPKIAVVKRYEAFGFKFAEVNEALSRKYQQAYHACISFIDAQMAILFESLKRNKLWDNTIVILVSDHGYHMGEHFLWGKVSLFEECARVPMIIRVPGMTKAGSKSESLVELVDIYPTLADLCGLKAPHKLQGKSLRPIFKDPSHTIKDSAYTVVSRGKVLGQAIRSSRYRYTEWGQASLNELYDLQKDPQEHKNLAKNPEYKTVLKTMQEMLNKKRESVSQ